MRRLPAPQQRACWASGGVQVRGLESKLQEYQEVLQCKLCLQVRRAGAARVVVPLVLLPLWRCMLAWFLGHVQHAVTCRTPLASHAFTAEAAQLRGAALPALPLLRRVPQGPRVGQPRLPGLQLRRQRLPGAAVDAMT